MESSVADRLKVVCIDLGLHNITITDCTCKAVQTVLPGYPCQVLDVLKCHVSAIRRIRSIKNTVVPSLLEIIRNFLVLMVRLPHRKKYVHYSLITGFVLSDFLFSLLFVATYVLETSSCYWAYGLVACKIFKSILMTKFTVKY